MKFDFVSYGISALILLAVIACKTKMPVAEEKLPDYAASMRQTQKEMENAFVYEHDLFIKLYHRSKQKEEIPYPQLHILIDSIQDFRNMHGSLLEYVETESETLDSVGLSDEAKRNVIQRIENVKSDADRVANRYATIMNQIGNLKMLYNIKAVHSVDWLNDKRLRQSELQQRLDKQSDYLKSEANRLGVNSMEENQDEPSGPEYSRLQELIGAHAYCGQYFHKMVETLNKAESLLTGTTWYEGPFIEIPSILAEFENVHVQTVQIMNEFDFLAQ